MTLSSVRAAIIFLLGASTAAFAQEQTPLAGLIWNTQKNDFVPVTEMVQYLAKKDFVLIGERHGRHAHQRREAFLIGALAEAGKHPTIAFEMVSHDQTDDIAAYRQQAPEYALGLAPILNWADSNWPAWSFYHPVFDMAFSTKSKIVGADDDELHANATMLEPGSDDVESFAHYRQQMLRAHCNLIDENRATELANIQIARDKHMAKILVESAHPEDGAVLIVGSAHIPKSVGIPSRLSSDDVTVLLLKETDLSQAEFLSTPAVSGIESLNEYDFVWFTPKVNDKSLCQLLEGTDANQSH